MSMNIEECQFTAATIAATKTNTWTNELRAHLSSCPICRETKEMTTTMNILTTNTATRAFPDYRILWMKAQLAKRQERLTTLDLVGLITVALGGTAGLAGLSVGLFPRLVSSLIALTGQPLPAIQSLVAANAPLGVLIGVGVMIWLITRDRRYAG